MIEILMTIFAVLFGVVLCWFVWQSSVIISERNKLRKITGKYYDFDIVEELRKREQQATDSKVEKVATTSKRKSKTKTTKAKL